MYGPYTYHSHKENGKVVSKYLGKESSVKEIKLKKDYKFLKNLFGIFILLLLIGFFIFYIQNGITGRASISINEKYNLGEVITGSVKINLNGGELLPSSTKLVIDNVGESSEYFLSDLVDFNLVSGNFYLENKNISGEGDGFGVLGYKEIYPEVHFVFELVDLDEESIGEENISENFGTEENMTIEEIKEETPIEENKEIVEETSVEEIEEEIVSTEVSDDEPVEESEESVSPLTGAAISSNEVEGSVSFNSPYTYELSEGKSVNLIFSDQEIDLVVEDGILIVTTEYFEIEEGFGEEYLTENETILNFDLSELNLTAKEGDLIISLVYDEEIILTKTTGINVGGSVEENITIPVVENFTELNITMNETFENVVINTTQYGAILGQPVKWKKQITLDEPEVVRIEIPFEATNISVFKIIEDSTNGDKTELEFGDVEEINEVDLNGNKSETKEKKKEQKFSITAEVVSGKVSLEVNLDEESKILGFFKKIFNTLTGRVVDVEEIEDIKEVVIDENATKFEIEYETPGPVAYEIELIYGKEVVIFDDNEIGYENILAYTFLENEVESYFISLYHIENNSRVLTNFTSYDLNNNSLVDYIEWVVPHLSNQTYEIEITILNVQSYPTVGGNWTVRFNTTGIADLTIKASNETTWSNFNEVEDLKFLELKCGEDLVNYSWINNSVFVENYTCDNQTGREVSKVLTEGIHDLEFDFGGIKAYAHNFASTSGILSDDFDDNSLNLSLWVEHNNTYSNTLEENELLNLTLSDEVSQGTGVSSYGNFTAAGNISIFFNYRRPVLTSNGLSGFWIMNSTYGRAINYYNNTEGPAIFYRLGRTCNNAVNYDNTGAGIYVNSTFRNSWGSCNYYTIMNNNSDIFSTNDWYDINITLAFDTGETELYVDNVLVANGTITAGNLSSIYPDFKLDFYASAYTDGERSTQIDNFTLTQTLYEQKVNVFSPINTTYSSSTIWFNATSEEPEDIWVVNYNGTNVTLSAINTTLEVEEGFHHLLFYVRDVRGNWGLNDSIYFSTSNSAPTQSTPIIVPNPATSLNNITCINQSTFDLDGDNVTNIYNWLVDGESILLLNMPFDTSVDSVGEGLIHDYSGFLNNGTLGGGDVSKSPTWNSSGKLGGAYEFDGVNDFINIYDADSLSSSELSVEVWVYPREITSSYPVYKSSGFELSYNDSTYGVERTFGGSVWNSSTSRVRINSSNSFALNQWHHVILTAEADLFINLYVDGVLENTIPFIGVPYDSAYNLTIGDYDEGGYAFNGTIDNFKIYNRSLSSQQISQLYLEGLTNYTNSTVVANEIFGGENWTCQVTANDGVSDSVIYQNYTIINSAPTQSTPIIVPNPATSSNNITCINQSTFDLDGDNVTNIYNWLVDGESILLLNMPFDTSVDSVGEGLIHDYSGFLNNGTLGGGDVSKSPTWNSSGRFGGAYEFDGVNDFIEIPKSSSLNNLTNFSLDVWVKPASTAQGYIFTNDNDGTVGSGDILLYKTGTLGYAYIGSPNNAVSSLFLFETNRWTHVVLVMIAGQSLRLYTNGTLVASDSSITSGPFINSSLDFRIGSTLLNTYNFSGEIDNLRIWNRSLSPLQVNQLYIQGLNNYTNSTIVSSETNGEENWTCQITGNDGIEDSIISQDFILLSPRVEVSLSPSTAYTNDTLHCTFNVSDSESSTLNATVKWYRDSVNIFNGSVLDYVPNTNYTFNLTNNYTYHDSAIFCNVTIINGVYEVSNVSSEIIIQNYSTSLSIVNETGKIAGEQVLFTANYSSIMIGDIGRTLLERGLLNFRRYASPVGFFDCENTGKKDCIVIGGESEAVSNNVVIVYNSTGDNKWNYTYFDGACRVIKVTDFDNDGYEDDFICAGRYLTIYNETGIVYINTSIQNSLDVAIYDADYDGIKDDFVLFNPLYVQSFNTSDGKTWDLLWNISLDASGSNGGGEIEVQDIDEDGQIDDIVVVDGTDNLAIFYYINNSGNILWNSTDVGSYAQALAIADLENDNLASDFVFTMSSKVMAFFSNGTSDWNSSVDYNLYGIPHELISLDLDNDNYLDDIVVGGLSLVAHDEKGVQLWNYTLSGGGVVALNSFDINDDGVQEIIAGTSEGFLLVLNKSGFLLWNYNISLGSVGSGDENTFTAGDSKGLDVSDINNDGVLDIATSSEQNYLHISQDVLCKIYFNDSTSGNMTWSTSDNQWEYSRSFSNGEYLYNVTCDKGAYETQLLGSGIEIGANEIPVINSLDLTPSTAYTNDTLHCTFNASDLESSTLNATVKWYRDSVNIFNGSVLDYVPNTNYTFNLTNNYTYHDSAIFCNITVTDGVYGVFAEDSLVIQNYSTGLSIVNETGKIAGEQVLFTANYSKDGGYNIVGLRNEIGRFVWINRVASTSLMSVATFDCEKTGRKGCVAVPYPAATVFYGNGTTKYSVSNSGWSSESVKAVDLNNDSYENEFVVSKGRWFNETGLVGSFGSGYAITFTDVDFNEIPEIVFGRTDVWVYYSNGTLIWSYDSVEIPDLESLDVNGDEIKDILVVENLDNLSVFNGLNGSLLWETEDYGLLSVGLIDLDSDGERDEIAVGGASGIIYFLNFSGGIIYTYDGGDTGIKEIEVNDFDNDGYEDEIGQVMDGSVLILKCNMTECSQLWSSPTVCGYLNIESSDINDDGKVDLIVSGDTDYFCAFDNDGTNLFNYLTGGDVGHWWSYGDSPAIDTGDLTNDGLQEAVVASYDNATYVSREVNCKIYFNDSTSGNMTWSTSNNQWEYSRSFSNGEYLYNVTCDKGAYETQLLGSGIEIGANEPPNDPVVDLVSVDGTNRSSVDLNCSALISDPEGYSMDVSVRWYKDGVLNQTLEYYNYLNNTIFSSIFDAGNISRGDNWVCSVRSYDGGMYSNWVNSSSLTILNTLPSVNLNSPEDNNLTINRTPEFSWNGNDVDNDALTYEFNLSLDASSLCSDLINPGVYSTGNDEFYLITEYLRCLYDNGDYYDWGVRANDGFGWGDWSEYRTLGIQSYVESSLVVDAVSFGLMLPEENNDTSDNSPAPFVLENNGNCFTNISLNASDLWNSIFGSSDYYQYKIDFFTGEEGSFNFDESVTNYLAVPNVTEIAIVRLNWSDVNDSAEIDINVTVPLSELAGDKSSLIVFTSDLGE